MTEEEYSKLCEVERLCARYADNIGRVTPVIRADIKDWIADGFEPEVINRAICATGCAPAPSLRYLRVIMARLKREDLKTAERLDSDGDPGKENASYNIAAAAAAMY